MSDDDLLSAQERDHLLVVASLTAAEGSATTTEVCKGVGDLRDADEDTNRQPTRRTTQRTLNSLDEAMYIRQGAPDSEKIHRIDERGRRWLREREMMLSATRQALAAREVTADE